MLEVRKTAIFARWLDGLDDYRARAMVLVRIERLAQGNPGDVRPVGEGVSELRIDYGLGFRVYFTKLGSEDSDLAGRGRQAHAGSGYSRRPATGTVVQGTQHGTIDS